MTTKTKWNAHLYDEKHDFVSKLGTSLVNLLAPQKNEHILDVGCGTGDLANDISALGASVLGVDASATMILAAQKNILPLTFKRWKLQRCTFLSNLMPFSPMPHFIG